MHHRCKAINTDFQQVHALSFAMVIRQIHLVFSLSGLSLLFENKHKNVSTIEMQLKQKFRPERFLLDETKQFQKCFVSAIL